MKTNMNAFASMPLLALLPQLAAAQTFTPAAADYTTFNVPYFTTLGTQSFSGSANSAGGTTIVAGTGSVTATGGLLAYGGYNYSFTNSAYPALVGPYTFFSASANNAPGPDPVTATFHIDFDRPLPAGSYVSIMDVDTGTLGEYGELFNFGPDAYLGMITNFGDPFNNSPTVSYSGGNWLVTSGDGGNSPQEISFFDASGITSLDYVGGFSTPHGGGAFTQMMVWVPVPEPSAFLLGGLGLPFLFFRRSRRGAA